jgi:hypothetical protein
MCDKHLVRQIIIKYCVKIGKSASEMSAPLTLAYGICYEETVSEWYRQVKEGREDVKDST